MEKQLMETHLAPVLTVGSKRVGLRCRKLLTGKAGAPECYRWNDITERSPLQVGQNVDIWSAGCVFSEAAIWVVRGWEGLLEYRRRRRLATERIPNFKNGGCFHDGAEVLEVVKDMHDNLAEDIRPSDHVTTPTLTRLVKDMLTEPQIRRSASSLYCISGRIISEAEEKLQRPASRRASLQNGLAKGGSKNSHETSRRIPLELPHGYSPSHPKFYSPSQIWSPSLRSTSPSMNVHIEKNDGEQNASNGASIIRRVSQQTHRSDSMGGKEYEDSSSFGSYSQQTRSAVNDPFLAPHPTRNISDIDHRRRRKSSLKRQDSLSSIPSEGDSPSETILGATAGDTDFVPSRGPNLKRGRHQHRSYTLPIGAMSRTSIGTPVQEPYSSLRASQHSMNTMRHSFSPESVNVSSATLRAETARRKPPQLPVAVAKQWKADKKAKKHVELPFAHLLEELGERDHVSSSAA